MVDARLAQPCGCSKTKSVRTLSNRLARPSIRDLITTIGAPTNAKEFNVAKIVRFFQDNSGATSIEYGLIAVGIAVAIVAVVNGLGTKLTAQYQSVSDNLK